jgi:hypothetical protein
MDYRKDFIDAKYHLMVAERMFDNYSKYPEKRFLVGVINEGAKAAASLVRAFMLYDRAIGGVEKFLRKVAPKYLDDAITKNIMKMLEVERAQKISRVEFARGNKIILLIHGKYRILTAERLGEFVRAVRKGLSNFPASIKR